MGIKEFYAANFHDLTKEVTHPIGCQDCHDPNTLKLRITRPALKEAFAAQGRDIHTATHQEMRSLVCAQCHVEYYFRTDAVAGRKNYLVFPWGKGTTLEDILAYYDEQDFSDYVHAISGTPIIKAQHPDYELYRTGIHSFRNVSCADCHMPYHTEGGVKYTDHHVQSPLLNIANSCVVCHRWREDEIRTRVETIQTKVEDAKRTAEDALVHAHFDVAAAVQAGVSAGDLGEARKLLRRAQFRWDFIAASNGMGFHAPQESMRLLGEAANQAQQVRVGVARLLAKRGITEPPRYPDVSTRSKASAVVQAFVDGQGVRLLP
jgi:nitrite reductase (cytochrome c-552)